MKLYLELKPMTFIEDGIEHQIINLVNDSGFLGCDEIIDLPDDDKFIENSLEITYKKDKNGKDTNEIDYKQFIIKEQKTWWSFPLYELKKGNIIPFNYTQYSYFSGTDRRMTLAEKINQLYNLPSELKVLRKTLSYIMNELKIIYPENFEKYNDKIETLIKKNPKN